MTKMETLQLKLTATRVRMGVIEGTHGAGCGHPGGSLSAADLFAYLYFRELRVDPANPHWEDRDRFVLSKAIRRRACMRLWRCGAFSRRRIC